MEFQIPITIKKPAQQINYRDKILLTGSCFSEEIGDLLLQHKFDILQNLNGILFDPLSICNSLTSYIENKQFSVDELFYLNEVWQSWQHHSRFSGLDKDEVLQKINQSQRQAHLFLEDAEWLIITVGTAYSYRVKKENESVPVANCHKAPADFFIKRLLTIEEILAALDNCMHRLFKYNKNLKIIFTVSPVRHIRDGIAENNRSKARLIETVHHMVNKFDRLYYFPAYELVLDVLRDYRFYNADLVHPNKMATQFVFDHFSDNYFDIETKGLMQEVKSIVTAKNHKPFQKTTKAHSQFLKQYYERTKILQEQNPFLNLHAELDYFSSGNETL